MNTHAPSGTSSPKPEGGPALTLRHRRHRILYVPLDDRPCNLKTPRLLAQMVDYELAMPPVEMLGSFRAAGQPDEIAEWLRAHVEPPLDCMILSLDMLAYGGLWASRASGTRTQLALQRMGILRELREGCPGAMILGFGSVTRLGTITSSDEAALHLEALARHSRLSGAQDAESGATLAALERQIPDPVLGEYLAVRGRNYETNRQAVRELRDGALDFLALGQDVAAAVGVHRSEQDGLKALAQELGVADRLAIVPGVDQLAPCLLARFIHTHMEKTPAVRLVVPAGETMEVVPAGEDRPFRESIGAHLGLIGAEVAAENDPHPDMILLVNPPAPYDRHALRQTTVARPHRQRSRDLLAQAGVVSQRRRLAVCDAAFSNGADDIFVQELVSATRELPSLLSYAGWNSGSNALGSALSEASVRLIALQDKGAFDLASAVGDMAPLRYLSLLDALIASEKAHVRLLLTRLADDWLYQARVRPRLLDHVCGGLRNGVFDLSTSYAQAEGLVRDELTRAISDLWIDQFLGHSCVPLGSSVEGQGTCIVLADLEETRVSLPWRRLFEVDVDLEFGVELAAE